ncbi:MAG TPA: protein kinase, partial [Thermoanaerobaculia bacterium]|nr:protein kinase [Thermoanaerobaculia bacterium]
DRLRRFEQEARAAGILNHPNITAVYDVGTFDGSPYVVTELLEGETLRSRLAGGALAPRRAIDYAIQIAHGLAAAHEKGIVHRDLKPENLFVTKDGRVKILDFGLAKLTQPEMGGPQTNLPTETAGTEPGIVMGTLSYMSPEQVRGRAADARSDIFSFGAILYEMLSGKRAFHRDTAADTMSAILREEPQDLSSTNRQVSPALDRIIRHCLEKDPEMRFHSAHDLAFDLDALSGVSSGTVAAAVPARRAFPGLFVVITALSIVAIAAAALLFSRSKTAEPPRTSFLTFSGTDSAPAVSSDGRLIAFVSSRDGRSRIWMKQIATGDEVVLTSGDDAAPRFSSDGSALMFAHAEGDESSLYRMSVVGGEPRKMIDDAIAGDWSPDASRIAFVRSREHGRAAGSVLVVAGSDGSAERVLATTSQLVIASPRWSPGGETIAYLLLGRTFGKADQIVLLDVASGESRPLPGRAGAGSISSLAWTSDGKGIVYAQSEEVTGFVPLSRLALQDVGSGTVRLLLWMPYLVTSVDLGPANVVFDALALSENLAELPFSSGKTAPDRLTRGNSMDRQPVYSPDGQRIAFSSTRSGNIDIWGIDRRDGSVRRLTQDPAQEWDPGFTRDGRTLLYSSNRGGHFEIWTAEADGRRARQLSRDGLDAENPTATPDGEWIVYASGNPEKHGVWKIRRDGSRAVRLTSDVTYHPEVSPDGQYVLYHTPPDPGWSEIRVARAADGRPVDFHIRVAFSGAQTPVALRGSTGSLGRARWTPDGRAIAFIAVDERNRTGVMLQDFAPGRDTTGTRHPIAGFDDQLSPESLGISPDGARLLVSSVQSSSGLMLADRIPGIAGRTSRR